MNSQQTPRGGPDGQSQPRPEPAPFDFRSPRFVMDARALQRLTGCTLVLCRQELFIAEGDALEAWQVLVGHPAAGMLPIFMH